MNADVSADNPRVTSTAPTHTGVAADPDAARAVIAPLYLDRRLPSGEPLLDHADGLVAIARSLRPDADLLAAGMLFAAHDVVRDADDWLAARFGAEVARLVGELRQLMKLSERTRGTLDASHQSEALRKMLIAMAGDLRVVLLRLASRLQTLRWFARSKLADKQRDAETLARETLQLYAPLANRLGVWQLKWELEDLAFRFLEPATYKDIAARLDAKRAQRESFIEEAMATMRALLAEAGIVADVAGRPKHLYSIWSKMKAKRLDFDQLYDVRALRVIVSDVAACYQVLSLVHERFTPVAGEYDDYIAKPKPNGYQSLHTVVTDRAGRTIEVQIRTREMHAFAELGVAAHWHYKEAGGAKRAASADAERVAWLRRLLAWRDEVEPPRPAGAADERIYVLTPQARVIELPAGATPIDFAYHVHTDLGHRCRGARVDGAMVPLNTKLATGQTVDIVAAKTGGPSRDWLNPELGFLASQRSRAKVRHWFNLVELEQTIAAGREVLGRELARLGRTAVKLDDLAQRLGFATVEELCVAVTKEEFSLRSIEQALAVAQPFAEAFTETPPALRAAAGTSAPAASAKGAVLVVGVDALLTSLARCCRPVPPDEIVGFVTRGKGVSIHRAACPNAVALSHQKPERLIEVTWGARAEASYPVDLIVLALDRPGLLRDVSEVFAREKLNVVGVNTVSRKGEAQMLFTVEVHDTPALRRALAQVSEVPGVFAARRR
jgi:GTP pyrophosphokinase